ncbi:MAG: hypothetical protein KAJ75_04545, partial [Alphaproteobacteria bacterium]|nr:hypothetical protein [Alphaproteobacteria bacterium]
NEFEVKWPVKVTVPVDGGRHHEQTFTAKFKILDHDKIESLDIAAIDDELLKESVVGFEGITDADGLEVPYSDENKALILNIVFVRLALMQAYSEAVIKHKRKN